MFGEMAHVHPLSIVWYVRGSQGAGALPTNGQVITTPIISTVANQVNDYLNPADGSSVSEDVVGVAGTRVERYLGQYYAMVSLTQDVDFTLVLQERTFLRLLDPTGATNQFKTVQTRVGKANAPFRETFQIMNAEARFQYTNGAGNTTAHDWTIVLRPM